MLLPPYHYWNIGCDVLVFAVRVGYVYLTPSQSISLLTRDAEAGRSIYQILPKILRFEVLLVYYMYLSTFGFCLVLRFARR